jgi:hypothetical protein
LYDSRCPSVGYEGFYLAVQFVGNNLMFRGKKLLLSFRLNGSEVKKGARKRMKTEAICFAENFVGLQRIIVLYLRRQKF